MNISKFHQSGGFLFSIHFATLLVLCILAWSVLISRPTIYDNEGGFAYGGYRLSLYPSGKYNLETYTDVWNQPPDLEKGTFKRDRETYTLRDDEIGTEVVYHLVRSNEAEYLLDKESYQRYRGGEDSKAPAVDIFYGKMGRCLKSREY